MHDCVARVARLATGCSLAEFGRFCAAFALEPRDRPPYTDLQFYAFMLSRGYLCGYRFSGRITGAPSVVPIEFTDPAFVCVECEEDTSWDHAVYWNGNNIIDPNKDGVFSPLDYKVKHWTPIYKLQ